MDERILTTEVTMALCFVRSGAECLLFPVRGDRGVFEGVFKYVWVFPAPAHAGHRQGGAAGEM